MMYSCHLLEVKTLQFCELSHDLIQLQQAMAAGRWTYRLSNGWWWVSVGKEAMTLLHLLSAEEWIQASPLSEQSHEETRLPKSNFCLLHSNLSSKENGDTLWEQKPHFPRLFRNEMERVSLSVSWAFWRQAKLGEGRGGKCERGAPHRLHLSLTPLGAGQWERALQVYGTIAGSAGIWSRETRIGHWIVCIEWVHTAWRNYSLHRRLATRLLQHLPPWNVDGKMKGIHFMRIKFIINHVHFLKEEKKLSIRNKRVEAKNVRTRPLRRQLGYDRVR